MPLIQLIYRSTVATDMSRLELAAILQSSIRRNLENGITGMLLHRRDCFLQVLEGKEEAVSETFERIAEDRRHRELLVLERTPILRRSFGDWSMGYSRSGPAEGPDLPGYTAFLDSGFARAELVRDPNFAKSILQDFVRGFALGTAAT